MALIELKNICKSYPLDGFTLNILKKISLSIEQGEFVAIMGPSGSGKSTLMNILGCLDKPSSGQYILDGRNVEKLSADELAAIRNQKIGFVFRDLTCCRAPRLWKMWSCRWFIPTCRRKKGNGGRKKL